MHSTHCVNRVVLTSLQPASFPAGHADDPAQIGFLRLRTARGALLPALPTGQPPPAQHEHRLKHVIQVWSCAKFDRCADDGDMRWNVLPSKRRGDTQHGENMSARRRIQARRRRLLPIDRYHTIRPGQLRGYAGDVWNVQPISVYDAGPSGWWQRDGAALLGRDSGRADALPCGHMAGPVELQL
ncbi:hypothetical protein BC834DRAFT_881351 [Gloeopeniophorella convolvens]|nr:hypothetical protein BC834DRAFT_881351 [Gloeopeniophorella convolvens]